MILEMIQTVSNYDLSHNLHGRANIRHLQPTIPD